MWVTFFDVRNVRKNRKRPRDTLTAQEPIARPSEFFVRKITKNVRM